MRAKETLQALLRLCFGLALVAVFVGGAAHLAFPQVNSSTSTWSIAGSIDGLPGAPASVSFTCSTTLGSPRCNIPGVNLQLDFYGVDSDSFTAKVQPSFASGATGGTCSPIFTDGTTVDQVDSISCTSSLYTVAARSKRGYFPCPSLFGGLQPSFNLTWSAKTACTTTTTTSTTTTTT